MKKSTRNKLAKLCKELDVKAKHWRNNAGQFSITAIAYSNCSRRIREIVRNDP